MSVAVVNVRPMGVAVIDFLVDVFMDVRAVERRSSVVRMGMMAVGMGVGMGMDELFVAVAVGVPLEQDDGNARGHQQEAGRHGPARRFAQNEYRRGRPDERPDAEKRTGPERAQTGQGPDIEDETQSIAEGAQEKPAHDRDPARPTAAQSQGQKNRKCPRGQTLDPGDADRVLVGDGAGEIVVRAPGGHGQKDEERAGPGERTRGRIPSQKYPRRRHGTQGQPEAEAGVLPEDEHRDQCGHQPLEVEEKRGGKAARPEKAQEQGDRTDDPPADDGPGQPGDIAPGERG